MTAQSIDQAKSVAKNIKDLRLDDRRILLTGGAGFIGSHTAVTLLEMGCEVTILDNLANSNVEVINRIQKIVGARAAQKLSFEKLDLKETKDVSRVLNDRGIEAVIHFAGLKAVGESVREPIRYFDVNLNSTLSLLSAMTEKNVKNIIFSSSATVYGERSTPPFSEKTPTDLEGISHAYGQTKLMIEEILTKFHAANKGWGITCLRYFNPIGAHSSGLIGEDPTGIPNNLMPYITRVAVGKLEKLTVHGNDYKTRDGTCERDYIHVTDLAEGHVAALKQLLLLSETNPDLRKYNLGTGNPSSVLEVIAAFKAAAGKDIPFVIGPRRAGDVPAMYADVTKANQELDWSAKLTLPNACEDSWNWQSKNPNGLS